MNSIVHMVHDYPITCAGIFLALICVLETVTSAVVDAIRGREQ